MVGLIRRSAVVLVVLLVAVAGVVAVPAAPAVAAPDDSEPVASVAPGLEAKAAAGEVPVIAVTRVPGEQVVDEVVADLPDDVAARATASAGPAHQVVATVDAEGLEALAANPDVVEVVENKVNRISAEPWAAAIGLPATHTAGWDGTGRTVAVLDTGVQADHPYLAGKVIGEACFSHDDVVLGYESLCQTGSTEVIGPGSAAPCPQSIPGCDHGTHVAGIVAGGPVTSPGALTGTGPGTSIIAIKVFSKGVTPEACGGGAPPCVVAFDSEIVAALTWLASLRTAGAPIAATLDAANLSLGGGLYSFACDGASPGITNGVDALRDLGVATVAASGNNGYNGRAGFAPRMSSPACISTVVSVGATTGTGTVAGYGNLTAGTTILAPGSSIVSSVPGGSYGVKSGTSMAAPVVAGSIAALREQDPSTTVGELITTLRTSASRVSTSVGSPMPELQLDAASLGVPSDVSGLATAGSFERVAVSWSAPPYAGATPITSYRVTASPGGRSCTTAGPVPACTVTGLVNGVSHTFTVQATNGQGTGAGTTVTGTPKPLPAGSPFGAIDVVRAGVGTVTASGWAIDPETSAPIPVHVYVGSAGYALTADGARPDVDAVYGYGPNHAYTMTRAASPGPKDVCIYAINFGVGATTLLGCRTVTVPGGSPIGSLDAATPRPGGIAVGGWALDPDTVASIPVHVYVDGVGYALTASGYRSDIATFFAPYGGNHAYDRFLPASPGAHRVCAYGINTGVGDNSLLGCRTVTVPGGSPFGSFDAASRNGNGSVNVGGWAIDPDTADSIPVSVFVYGPGYALTEFPLTANLNRPDVAAVFPPYGAPHGFSATVGSGVPAGSTACMLAVNVGVGGSTLLGCKAL